MTAFKIGTWNCRMGFDRKRAAAEKLGCDVLVVPECSSKPALSREAGVSFEWKKGRFSSKGLGVFGFRGWRLEPVKETTPLPWVLPVRILDPAGSEAALLLAIWTIQNKEERWPSYSAQVGAAIDAWEREIRTGRVILAGDLNCSVQGPSVDPHLGNIARLEEMGARSAYHAHGRVAHGEESEMTLRWIGPGKRVHLYHCDFTFLSSAIGHRLECVEVGSIADWVESNLSDHVPVLAHLKAG